MALRIFNNLVSFSAQRLLGQNNDRLSQVFSRISSGLRIEKSSDDSAGLMASEALNTDARTIRQGVRNLNDGLSMLNVADGALAEQTSIVIRMRELSTQSATGTIGATDRQASSLEFNAMRSELDRISKSTEYNGIKLLNGALSSSASEHVSLQFGLDSKELNRVNINRVVNVTSLSAQDLGLNSLSIASQDGASKAATALEIVLAKFTEIRGRLGSTQNRLNRSLNNIFKFIYNLFKK